MPVFFVVNARYTWKIYSERLMTLAGVYGFWKYVSKLERRETRRYLEMFYILKFRELVCSVLNSVCSQYLEIICAVPPRLVLGIYINSASSPIHCMIDWLLLSLRAGEDSAACN
jgi:hypothetical protein